MASVDQIIATINSNLKGDDIRDIVDTIRSSPVKIKAYALLTKKYLEKGYAGAGSTKTIRGMQVSTYTRNQRIAMMKAIGSANLLKSPEYDGALRDYLVRKKKEQQVKKDERLKLKRQLMGANQFERQANPDKSRRYQLFKEYRATIRNTKMAYAGPNELDGLIRIPKRYATGSLGGDRSAEPYKTYAGGFGGRPVELP